MKTLQLSRNTFDYERKFKVEGVRGDVSLHQGKEKADDGIYYGLQAGTMVKSHYSQEEIAHKERMRTEAPIKNGEIVLINGEQYKAKVIGNYSDCIDFIPVVS